MAEVQKHEAKQKRGRLKVFFGMAAGVGKTFAMLEEARARHLPAETVQRLIDQCTEGRDFGVLGDPRVNVLKLNLALDGR